jgi:PAS domain S-box-containing protein
MVDIGWGISVPVTMNIRWGRGRRRVLSNDASSDFIPHVENMSRTRKTVTETLTSSAGRANDTLPSHDGKLMIDLLSVMNTSTDRRELIENIVRILSEHLGCDAVGIRLKEGEDFPYFETRGFPREFVRAENKLCAVDQRGELIRDSQGNPVIECMCGNVICGRFNPSLPFFTKNGSFWSNGTTKLLASTAEADRQARTRNRCNGEGYESVALIPLKCGAETYGLLQINHFSEDFFDERLIASLEDVSQYLSVALSRQDAKDALSRGRQLLDSIQNAQSLYITGGDTKLVFGKLLETLVGLTESEFGYFDEVLLDEKGNKYKVNLAVSDFSQVPGASKLYERIASQGLEFRNLNNLSGAPIRTGQVCIANDPSHDPRSGGLPPGHPALKSFLGMPLYFGGELVGVAGVANRPGGYTQDTATFLEPFLSTCAAIIHSTKLRAREVEAQKNLSANERLLQSIMDAIGESVFLIDDAGVFEYANIRGAQRLGYTPGEIIGRSIAELLPSDLAGRRLSKIQEVIRTGQPLTHEDVRGGRWYLNLFYPVKAETGKSRRAAVVTKDITERRQMENALIQREQALTQAQELAHLGSWTYDPGTGELHWSDEMYNIFGFDKAKGVPPIEVQLRLLSPAEAEIQTEAIAAVISEGTKFEMEQVISRPDGQVIHIISKAQAVRDTNGRITHVLGAVLDNTDRTLLLEKLRKDELRFRMLYEAAPVGYQSLDAEGCIIDVNQTWLDTLGYSQDEVIGHWFGEFLVKEEQDLFRRRFPTFKAAGSISGTEFKMTHKSGVPVHVSFDGRIGYDQEGNFRQTHCVFHNITERKQAEKERHILQEQLAQAQKMESVGRLAGGVAHDFNNILVPIIGYSELLLSDMPTDDPNHENVMEIHRAAERAKGLISQLLSFSRKQVFEMKPVSLSEIVRSLESMLLRAIREDIELRIEAPESIGSIQADTGQIQQILLNLATNARDAMPHGGILTISVREEETLDVIEAPIRRVQMPPGKYVVLAVTDNGSGMDSITLQRIFEPFFTTKEPGKGTGLGLPTVLGVVKGHSGYICIRSEPGKGTRFELYFPPTSQVAEIQIEPETKTASTDGHETILVAEDDDMVREIVSRTLRRAGYSVQSVGDPTECLALVAKRDCHIDLLLTDIIMPVMNGRELYETLAVDCGELRVLYMSGYAGENISHQGILEDNINFLRKPFTLEGLLQKVRQVLDLPRPEQEPAIADSSSDD